jgi:hypothetical protein
VVGVSALLLLFWEGWFKTGDIERTVLRRGWGELIEIVLETVSRERRFKGRSIPSVLLFSFFGVVPCSFVGLRRTNTLIRLDATMSFYEGGRSPLLWFLTLMKRRRKVCVDK